MTAPKPLEEHKPSGRPTVYQDGYPDQAERLVRLGLTDSEIAEFFEVDPLTIYRWKDKYPKFCKSLKRGKAEADNLVEESLYKRAVGFSRKAVKIFMPAGATEPVYAEFVEHFAPDPGAAKLWLTNRKPTEWRDRQSVEHSGSIDVGLADKLEQARKRGAE